MILFHVYVSSDVMKHIFLKIEIFSLLSSIYIEIINALNRK